MQFREYEATVIVPQFISLKPNLVGIESAFVLKLIHDVFSCRLETAYNDDGTEDTLKLYNC